MKYKLIAMIIFVCVDLMGCATDLKLSNTEDDSASTKTSKIVTQDDCRLEPQEMRFANTLKVNRS